MPFTYDATIQDEVARGVFGIPYASLTTDRKGIVDGGATTPLGTALRVQQLIAGTAGLLYGEPVIPSEWGHWFVAELCARVAGQLRLEKYRELRDIADRSRVEAVQSATTRAMNDSAFNNDLTTQAIVLGTIPTLAKLGVFVTRQQVDEAVYATIAETWAAHKWSFKAFQAVGTVNTSGVVSWSTPSALTVDKIAISAMYLQDEGDRAKVEYVDSETMAAIKAVAGASPPAGRPQWFYLERGTSSADTLVYQFHPVPDKTYTLIAAIEVETPAAPSSFTDASPFNKFPVEFKSLIRNGVMARLLLAGGSNQASFYMDLFRGDLATLGKRYASVGQAGAIGRRVADTYQDQHYGNWGPIGGAM